jgi:hypothetical protein
MEKTFPSVGLCLKESRPVGRTAAPLGEESPGSEETRRRITSGGGDPRDSATESRPPAGFRAWPVRVKGCGKSAPRDRQRERHGKPRREQDQIGAIPAGDRRGRFPAFRPGWLLEAAGNRRPRGMAVTRGATRALQNPAYRPTGNFLRVQRRTTRCLADSRVLPAPRFLARTSRLPSV